MKKNLLGLGTLLTLVLIAALSLLASGACAPEEPVARSYSCAVYTEQGCAKYVVASGGAIEVQSGGSFQVTPGATVELGGYVSTGGINVFVDAVKISAPTAIATATPALVVDSLGEGNVLLDVRDAATPVFSVNNGGGWTSTGAGTHSSGQTVNNWVKISAPTAIATATPAMIVDSLGVSNIFEVRDAATPVFRVENGGAVRGTYWTVAFEAVDTAIVASQDPIFTFQMPFAATLIEASAACRDIDVADTDETYAFALEDDGSAITSAWAVTADNTVDLATIGTAAVADNSKMEVTLTLGGTSPSAEDCYVLLTFTVQ